MLYTPIEFLTIRAINKIIKQAGRWRHGWTEPNVHVWRDGYTTTAPLMGDRLKQLMPSCAAYPVHWHHDPGELSCYPPQGRYLCHADRYCTDFARDYFSYKGSFRSLVLLSILRGKGSVDTEKLSLLEPGYAIIIPAKDHYSIRNYSKTENLYVYTTWGMEWNTPENSLFIGYQN